MEPKHTSHEWEHWMDLILREGTNLTAWEEDFIESIRLVLDTHRTLSLKQEEILERIYAARTS